MKDKSFEDTLNKLKKKYQQKYGVAVFNIEAKKKDNRWDLQGCVLTENQKDEVISLLKKNSIEVVGEKISVLSDEKERNEIGWGIVGCGIVDLKSRFVSNKIISERILKRIRCSQAFEGEIVRILFDKEDQLLAQQSDLTIGWIDKKNVIAKKESFRKKWHNGNFAAEDKTIKSDASKDRIVKEAKKFIGTEYVLGGKSKKGIDCSGLVQTVYKNSMDIVLPKHSWDQIKVGKKIKPEDAESGDLIFLVKKRNGHKHVGIVEKSGDKIYLIHASLDGKRVARQNMDEIFDDYDFVEARRIV